MKMRWKELTVAFLLSVALWYMVTGSEKVETQVEVRLEYRGQPPNLKIKDGLVSQLTVRVRGSRGLLRSASMQGMPYSMDLSGLVKGTNIIPIPKEKLPFWSGIEVIDVSPSYLEINADIAVIKSVPLEAEVTGEMPPDHQVMVTFAPPTVQLRGASEVIEEVKSVRVPVALSNSTGIGRHSMRQRLVPPDGLDATPNEVAVNVEIVEKRKEVTLTKSIGVQDAPEEYGYFLRPDKVRITLSVLESLAAKIGSNKDITAWVRLENQDLGSYSLPVRVSLPDGVRLVEIDPPTATVTVEQKHGK